MVRGRVSLNRIMMNIVHAANRIDKFSFCFPCVSCCCLLWIKKNYEFHNYSFRFPLMWNDGFKNIVTRSLMESNICILVNKEKPKIKLRKCKGYQDRSNRRFTWMKNKMEFRNAIKFFKQNIVIVLLVLVMQHYCIHIPNVLSNNDKIVAEQPTTNRNGSDKQVPFVEYFIEHNVSQSDAKKRFFEIGIKLLEGMFPSYSHCHTWVQSHIYSQIFQINLNPRGVRRAQTKL